VSTEFWIRAAEPEDTSPVSALLKASYSALMPAGYDETTLAGTLPLMTRANPRLLSSGTIFVAAAAGVRRFECYASINAEDFFAASGFKMVRRIEISMATGLIMPSFLMERPI